MKRLSIIICVVALIGASLQSCSDNKSANMETPNAPMKIRGNNSRDTTHRQSRFDVYYLVDEYPEFFGSKVLIFDSLPCVDSLLCELSEADPSDLRDLYSNLCIYNPIIESNIIYDSVMNAIAEDLRIDLESDTLTETTLAWFLDEFTQTMVDWYADQCIVGEAINDELESYQTVSPIGNIDERALCNEMGIFIADQVVFKFSGDYLLTCPRPQVLMASMKMILLLESLAGATTLMNPLEMECVQLIDTLTTIGETMWGLMVIVK